VCWEEGRLGAQVDQRPRGHIRRAGHRLCGRGGHLFQWLLCQHLLAEEEGPDARASVQQ